MAVHLNTKRKTCFIAFENETKYKPSAIFVVRVASLGISRRLRESAVQSESSAMKRK